MEYGTYMGESVGAGMVIAGIPAPRRKFFKRRE